MPACDRKRHDLTPSMSQTRPRIIPVLSRLRLRSCGRRCAAELPGAGDCCGRHVNQHDAPWLSTKDHRPTERSAMVVREQRAGLPPGGTSAWHTSRARWTPPEQDQAGSLNSSLIHVRIPRSTADHRQATTRAGDQYGQPWTVILNPEKRKVGSSTLL
jgi:hypothetical protein